MLIPRGIYRDRDRRPTFRIRYGIRGADRLCHGIPTGDIIPARGTKDHYKDQNQVSHELMFLFTKKNP